LNELLSELGRLLSDDTTQTVFFPLHRLLSRKKKDWNVKAFKTKINADSAFAPVLSTPAATIDLGVSLVCVEKIQGSWAWRQDREAELSLLYNNR